MLSMPQFIEKFKVLLGAENSQTKMARIKNIRFANHRLIGFSDVFSNKKGKR